MVIVAIILGWIGAVFIGLGAKEDNYDKRGVLIIIGLTLIMGTSFWLGIMV